MLNLERLLAPVSAERPCGEDLVFSSEIDAIVRARQADDPSLEQGAWVAELKEADWKFVARQCAQLIEKRSKDLQLAVWLAEAEARTSGLRGLADSLLLVAALCERWWDGLYPLPDEDGHERRIGNLAWMASRIAPLLREIPLTEGQPGYALRDFDVARMHGGEELAKLETAKARSSPTFYEALLRDCEHCAGALERIEHSVDERLGVDGPSFSAAKSGLQSLVLFVKPMVKPIVKAGRAPADNGQAGTGAPAAAPVAAAGAGTAGAAAPAMELRAGPPQSRTQALAQLREVAEFFRRTEPHSPVAYLAEKAAHWGEQPLHVWLRSVVKDDASFAHIEEMLGVAPPSQA